MTDEARILDEKGWRNRGLTPQDTVSGASAVYVACLLAVLEIVIMIVMDSQSVDAENPRILARRELRSSRFFVSRSTHLISGKRPWRSREVPDHEFGSIEYRRPSATTLENDVRPSPAPAPAPALPEPALSCDPLTLLTVSPGLCSRLHGTPSPQLPQRPGRSPSSSSSSQLPTGTSSTRPRSTFPTFHTSPWFRATLFTIRGL
jgi:hypothetical protein